MISKKKLTLTIVIPAYNEERYIKRCLESVAHQTLLPDEVIVVDNNSTDDTVKIAKAFPFVKILHESRQHQVFAQAAGFDAARSDLLGRIDADSILPADWVEKIVAAFSQDNIVAVTGGAAPYDMPAKMIGTAIFDWYLFMVRLIAGFRMLWGANCALRRSAWRKIRGEVLLRPDIWEDYDMSFCLARLGKIKYIHGNKVGASFRAVHTSFIKHVRYQFRSVRTLYFRLNKFKLMLFVILWTTTFLIYPAAALDNYRQKRRES